MAPMPTLTINPDRMRRQREALPTHLRSLSILAARICVNKSTLSRWENGKAMPNRAVAFLWARELRQLQAIGTSQTLRKRA